MRDIPNSGWKSVGVAVLLAAAVPLQAQEPGPELGSRTLQLTNPAPLLPGASAPQLEGITLFPDDLEVDRALTDLDDPRSWQFVLHGSARAAYSSNIFIQNVDQEEDFIFKVAPGVAYGYGDFKSEIFDLGTFREPFERDRSQLFEEKKYIFLNYIPSYTVFLDHGGENTFDHDAALEGSYQVQKLRTGLKLRYQTLNSPDIDLGERTKQKRFNAELTTEYDFSDRSSFELNGYAFIRDHERHIDINEFRAQTWLNYLVQPKINLSTGFSYGHVAVSDGPSQDYEQALARARYRATQTVQLNATAGVEFRQVENFDHQTNVIFSAGGCYQPFDGTSLYLQGYRRNQTSATSSGLNYTTSGIDGRWQQRLLQRCYFALAGGYQMADYDNHTGFNSDREDDIFYVRPSVGFDLTKWLSAEVGGEYRDNDSSEEIRSFAEASAYVQLNVLF